MRVSQTGHGGYKGARGAARRAVAALFNAGRGSAFAVPFVATATLACQPGQPGLRLVAEAQAQEQTDEPTTPTDNPRAAPPEIALADAGGRGARIARVDPASPAAILLQAGDRVVAADGRPIRRAAELQAHFAALDEGAPVLLEIVRRGRTRLVGVQLTTRPRPPAPPPRAFAPPAPPPVPIVLLQPVLPPPTVVVVIQGPPAFPVLLDGGRDHFRSAPRPPVFSAPGLPEVPGATFAPGPGTSAFAYPQIPGVAQPPGFAVPMR